MQQKRIVGIAPTRTSGITLVDQSMIYCAILILASTISAISAKVRTKISAIANDGIEPSVSRICSWRVFFLSQF